MITIKGNSVASVFTQAMSLFRDAPGSFSRNGPVAVVSEPVTSVYLQPRNHVLIGAQRNANPIFHVIEALWMLSGRNDLSVPARFNKRFAEYSDDGSVLNGAYGHRWRTYFGYDQLDAIVEDLRRNPNSRRAVLGMWSPSDDLHTAGHGGKDVPCNTHAYFDVRDGKLNMQVCCRSNDAIWGAYGANVVHFSMLHEYMAARIGFPQGWYEQVSFNFHVYTDVYPRAGLMQMALGCSMEDPHKFYTPLHRVPLVNRPDTWDADLRLFMALTDNADLLWALSDEEADSKFSRNPFFCDVAVPMLHIHDILKTNIEPSKERYTAIRDGAWRAAVISWVEETARRKRVKAQGAK